MQILAHACPCANHGCLRKGICYPHLQHIPLGGVLLPESCYLLLLANVCPILEDTEKAACCAPYISRCKLQWCPFKSPIASSLCCLTDFRCLRSLLSTVLEILGMLTLCLLPPCPSFGSKEQMHLRSNSSKDHKTVSGPESSLRNASIRTQTFMPSPFSSHSLHVRPWIRVLKPLTCIRFYNLLLEFHVLCPRVWASQGNPLPCLKLMSNSFLISSTFPSFPLSLTRIKKNLT